MENQVPPPPQPAPIAPAKSNKWPWIAGCGCLTLILVVGAIVAFFVYRLSNDPGANKRRSTQFNPYQGSLAELLLPEIGSGLIKFNLKEKQDITATAKKTVDDLKEGFNFFYEEKAGDSKTLMTFKIYGKVANFSSSAAADKWLDAQARDLNATPSAKNGGRRFTTKQNGRALVCWTNGSVGCFAFTSDTNVPKPVEDFEKACAF